MNLRKPESAKAAAVVLICTLTVVARPALAQSPAYPDATNTGVPPGTALTIVSGDLTIKTNGTIVENKDIRGCILVQASSVIIRKSKVSGCNNIGVIYADSGTNLLVEDSELICNGATGSNGLTPLRAGTARRVNISNCENGIWAEDNTLIEDSFVHDMIPYDPKTDPHTDSIQIPQGAANVVVRHNTVYGDYINQTNFGSAALTAGTNLTNVLVENNIFAGAGYSLRISENGGGNTNVRIRNNRFSTIFTPKVGGYGPTAIENVTEDCGSVYHETGKLLAGEALCQGTKTPSAPTNFQTK